MLHICLPPILTYTANILPVSSKHRFSEGFKNAWFHHRVLLYGFHYGTLHYGDVSRAESTSARFVTASSKTLSIHLGGYL
jgi:hypothetical protein